MQNEHNDGIDVQNNQVQQPSPVVGNPIPEGPSPVNTEFLTQQFNEKKKKSKLPIMIAILVLVLAGIGFFLYQSFAKNPTDIFKIVINNSYKEFHEFINEVKDNENEKKFNLKDDSLLIEGDLKLSGTLLDLNQLKDDKISYRFGVDLKNKVAEIGGALNEDNVELIDANVYFKNNKGYLKSNTMFNNIYETEDELNFDEMFDIDLDEIEKLADLSVLDDVDALYKDFKDIIIDSLDSKSMTMSKEEIMVNDKKVKTTKVVYALNKDSIMNFSKSFADTALKNEELLKKLASVSSTDIEEIKNALQEMKDESTYTNLSDDEGNVIIYTTGALHKFVRFELVDKDAKLTYSDYENVKTFEFAGKDDASKDINVKVVITEKDDKNQNVEFYYNNTKVLSIEIKEINDKTTEVTMNLTYDYEGTKFNATLKMNDKQVSDTKEEAAFKFDFEVTVGGKTQNIGIESNLVLTFNEKIADIDTKKALSTNDMTQEDALKAQTAMSKVMTSKAYKYFEVLSSMASSFGFGANI